MAAGHGARGGPNELGDEPDTVGRSTAAGEPEAVSEPEPANEREDSGESAAVGGPGRTGEVEQAGGPGAGRAGEAEQAGGHGAGGAAMAGGAADLAGRPGVPGQWHAARAASGDPRVDHALTGLDGLADLPVSEHPAVFERIHGQLVEVLGELRSGPGPGGYGRQAG